MATCPNCGQNTGILDIRSGKCGYCRGQEALAERDVERAAEAEKEKVLRQRREAANRVVLTTETAHNLAVKERLGIVAGERVFGLNAFKDLFTDVRGLVGGKSGTLEKAFSDARSDALSAMAEKAFDLGADAVVGVSFTHDQVGSGAGIQGSMVMVVATGTAVKLS